MILPPRFCYFNAPYFRKKYYISNVKFGLRLLAVELRTLNTELLGIHKVCCL